MHRFTVKAPPRICHFLYITLRPFHKPRAIKKETISHPGDTFKKEDERFIAIFQTVA